MKRFTIVFLICIALFSTVAFADTQEVSTTQQVINTFQDNMTDTIVVFLFRLFGYGLMALFGYLAVKFPKLAKYFYEMKEKAKEEVDRTEQKRLTITGDLTAKQGIQLKNETAERLMNTRPAQELRRGVANIFGIFGGRAKEFGKQLFDNSVPGLIDNQVSKLSSKLK